MRSQCIGLALLIAAANSAAADVGGPLAAPNVIGFVRDTAGMPLPGVEVVVERLNRTATTDAHGRFILRALRAGTYHLEAHLIGYAPAHGVVTVPDAGQDVTVTLIMRISPLQLSALHVTATPSAANPVTSTRAVTELSGQALARDLSANVAQTLETQPGMATRYAGPAASTPVIRGLSGERVLVVQDGQRAGDLSSTSADHSLSVDPLAASRIEVVRGPASLLYGNNALGGVVNVISNNIPSTVPEDRDGFLALQGETANPGGAFSGSLTTPLTPTVALTLRAGGRRVGDVRIGGPGTLPNSDAENLHGNAGIGYVSERITGGLAYQLYDFNYGIPAASNDEAAGVRIDGRRHTIETRADLALGRHGFNNLRLDGTLQWYEHDEIEPAGEVGTTFTLKTQTVNATARTLLGPLTGSVGISGLFHQYDPRGEEALTPGATSNSGGVFLYQELPVGSSSAAQEEQHDGAARVQLGARYDVYALDTRASEQFGPSRSRTFRNFSGSLGLTVPVAEIVTIGASVARAFRAPTVEELYADGFHAAVAAFQIGDPELESETNTGIDGVVRIHSRRVHGQLSGYYNRIERYIHEAIAEETDPDPEFPTLVFAQSDATIRGMELELESEVARHLVLGVMADVIRGTFTTGDPLPFMPAGRVGGTIRFDNSRYSLGVEGRHVFAQDDVPAGEFATEDYDLVNLTAGWNLIVRGLVHSITLRIDNLLDKQYRDATSRIKSFAPNPGRNLAIVYRMLF